MLTVPEVAVNFGRDPETVRRWIRSGRLRALKVGTQHVVEEMQKDWRAPTHLTESVRRVTDFLTRHTP